MISLLSFLGRALDKTRLDTQNKDRFAQINTHLQKAYGGIGWVFVCLVLSIVAGAWVWYSATHPTPARFFMVEPPSAVLAEGSAQIAATPVAPSDNNPSGKRVHELNTTLTPRMSTARVQSWVTSALMETYSFNFVNADEVLGNARWVFRPDTYQTFMNEMNKRGGILETVKNNSLIVSLTPTGDVLITRQGKYGDTRIWELEMKALIYYSGALKSPPPPQYVNFTMMVQEVAPTENPYGMVIVRIKQNQKN